MEGERGGCSVQEHRRDLRDAVGAGGLAPGRLDVDDEVRQGVQWSRFLAAR
jgi:hypothetical protein